MITISGLHLKHYIYNVVHSFLLSLQSSLCMESVDEFLSSRLVLYSRLAVNAYSLYYVPPSVFVQSAQLVYFCWSWFVHIDQPCTLSYRVIGLLVSCNMLANLCIIRFSVAPVSFSTSAVRTLLPFGRPNVSAYVEKKLACSWFPPAHTSAHI